MTTMTTTIDTLYRTALDHQASLRREVALDHVFQSINGRSGAPLPPTRGPLAALRRRLAGAASFA